MVNRFQVSGFMFQVSSYGLQAASHASIEGPRPALDPIG